MAVDGTALATSLGINGGFCALFILIFAVLRVRPVTRRFYAPKRFDPEVKVKPHRLSMGLFSWVRPVLSYPESEIIEVAGLDVAVFLRLLMYGLVLFAFTTLWCCIILMPINGTAGGLAALGNTTATDIDKISVSNIPSGSPGNQRFWAHLVSAYVISIFAMMLLANFSKDVSTMRARFISTVPRTAENHTVLVTDLPGLSNGGFAGKALGGLKKTALAATGAVASATDAAKRVVKTAAAPGNELEDGGPARVAPLPDDVLDPRLSAQRHLEGGGTVESMVTEEMNAAYGHVASVNPVYDTTKIMPLVNNYTQIKGQLSDIVEDYIGKLRRKVDIPPNKRKTSTLLPGLAPAWAREKYSVGAKPVKVDALEYMPLALDKLRGEIKEQAAKASDDHLPAAFVTFNNRYTQTVAATGLHAQDELTWRVQAAPGSEEIIWSNLGVPYIQRVVRGLAMWALFVTILIFYLPVVAAIQAVVNLENVRSVPGLGKVADIPFITQILQGILPSLVLKIFLAILPIILDKMSRFQGMVSVSEIDFSIVNRYFIFQVFAVFIYSFVIGSALSQIQAILQNPQVLVNLLGIAAPQQATFFMTYIMISALSNGFGILRLVPLVIYFIKDKLAGTEKAKYRLWAKQDHTFGTYVADHSLVILLGLAYCCLTPLVTPFCLLYFALTLLSQKYQLIYVLQHAYEAEGRMWITVFHQIMVGIYFLQAIVATVLGVKRFPYAALILPLVVATVVFHWALAKLFKRPWTLTSIREASMLDARDAKELTPEERSALHQLYLNPAFKMDDAEHDELLANAKMVQEQLLGGGTGELRFKDVEMSQSEAAE